jgi:hypothetical protein
MGLIGYSTNYVCGLLIDGFQYPPTILTAHNPPYHAALIEACCFGKVKDWYAWWFSEFAAPAERLRKIAVARTSKHGVKIRQINPKSIDNEGQRIRAIYNQAWRKNWALCRLPRPKASISQKK